ncbi:hypothetical protein AB1046_16700 [Promicromonospora sp. Populi]|uniref:hypothetical protein n=1 Tax=Promicromonospora sp. Populi TaxID=3239420 RepID=UPI0034E24AE7
MRRVTSAVSPAMSRKSFSNALTCTVTAALLVSPATGAVAAPSPGPEDVPRTSAALSAPTPFVSVPPGPAGPVEISADVTHLDLDDNGDAIVTRRDEQRIAPGLELTRFARMSEDGWLSGEALVADLGPTAAGATGERGTGQRGKVQVGYVGPEHVADTATVSEMAGSAALSPP